MGQPIPYITKNLLILNALFFGAKWLLINYGIDLDVLLAAFFPLSPNFHWYQIITHMFMHANLPHFFFNMFALWMFGSVVENTLETKKYLILYFSCGLGAFVLFNFVNYLELKPYIDTLVEQGVSFDDFSKYASLHYNQTYNNDVYYQMLNTWYRTLPSGVSQEAVQKVFISQISPMLGASGAIYGILVAFGVMFPNVKLMLIFPPIPIKAKIFIPLMVLGELFFGLQGNPNDGVAHFAHLGGAIIGFFMVRYWIKNRYRWN